MTTAQTIHELLRDLHTRAPGRHHRRTDEVVRLIGLCGDEDPPTNGQADRALRSLHDRGLVEYTSEGWAYLSDGHGELGLG